MTRFALAPLVTALGLLMGAGWSASAAAETPIILATQPGLPAYDRDAFGGNPFATALIAALADPAVDGLATLAEQTVRHSDALQHADFGGAGEDARLVPEPGEAALALVIVFADYGDYDGLESLPGVAFDAHRVADALAGAGYGVTTLIARDAGEYLAALDAFARTADEADRALVYTTGHGVEVDGTLYLIPPEAERAPAMLAAALRLEDIRARLDGPGARLLLYAGCRDNPLGLTARQ